MVGMRIINGGIHVLRLFKNRHIASELQECIMSNFTTTLCWINHDKSSFYLASMVRAWKVFISKKYVQKTHRTTVKNTKMKNRKWLGSDQLMSREGGEGNNIPVPIWHHQRYYRSVQYVVSIGIQVI